MHTNFHSPNYKRIMKSFLNHRTNSYVILEKETLIPRTNLGNYLTKLLNRKFLTKKKVGKRVFYTLTDKGFTEFNYHINGVVFS